MSLLIKKIAFIFFSIILGGGDLDARLLEVLVDELIREEKTINKRGVRNLRIYLTFKGVIIGSALTLKWICGVYADLGQP